MVSQADDLSRRRKCSGTRLEKAADGSEPNLEVSAIIIGVEYLRQERLRFWRKLHDFGGRGVAPASSSNVGVFIVHSPTLRRRLSDWLRAAHRQGHIRRQLRTA